MKLMLLECVWRLESPRLALGDVPAETLLHGAENRCGAFFMYGVIVHADTSSRHYCTILTSSDRSTQATANTPQSTDNLKQRARIRRLPKTARHLAVQVRT